MAWSKITDKKTPKSLRWWRLKILCELYYHLGNYSKYNKYLSDMIFKTKLNLYGEQIIKPPKISTVIVSEIREGSYLNTN